MKKILGLQAPMELASFFQVKEPLKDLRRYCTICYEIKQIFGKIFATIAYCKK